jgi:hypothetical protein
VIAVKAVVYSNNFYYLVLESYRMTLKPKINVNFDGNKQIKSQTVRIIIPIALLSIIALAILYFINKKDAPSEKNKTIIEQKNTNGNNKVINVEKSTGNNDFSEKTENNTITNVYTTPTITKSEDKKDKMLFSINIPNKLIIAELVKHGFKYSTQNTGYNIEIKASEDVKILPDTELYFFSGGFLKVKVNNLEITFPNYKIQQTFKYGNSKLYIENYISKSIDSLIRNNLADITSKIIENLK